jgi:Ca2+-binding EF-hand superfamily protein
MKTLNILAAAVAATLAVVAYAAPYGPGPGCAGAQAGTAGCPAYGAGGSGPGRGAGPGGIARWDADGDGKLSRQEVANAPRLAQEFDAIDANKDGFLTIEELQAARQAYGPGGRGGGWAKWDADGDGKISRQEAANAPRLSQYFDTIDANKDGFLTADELQAARQAHGPGRHGGQGQGWLRWDADGDGKLSRQEVANAPRLAQDFDAIDTNRDGFLTADELQAAHGRYAGRGGPRGF